MESDLINRQMAINTIMEQPPDPHYPIWYAEQIIALPSAQPNVQDSAKDADCISRRAAIDALGDGAMVNYQATGHNNGLVKAIDIIKGLPSAQPERTGKWLEIPHTFMWQCSLCSWINDISSGFNYCPDCGAKMEGEEHD